MTSIFDLEPKTPYLTNDPTRRHHLAAVFAAHGAIVAAVCDVAPEPVFDQELRKLGADPYQASTDDQIWLKVLAATAARQGDEEARLAGIDQLHAAVWSSLGPLVLEALQAPPEDLPIPDSTSNSSTPQEHASISERWATFGNEIVGKALQDMPIIWPGAAPESIPVPA